ncbi:MAG: hypothetical protein QXU98_08435 [Candidatus Parvarchaeota archaeon]
MTPKWIFLFAPLLLISIANANYTNYYSSIYFSNPTQNICLIYNACGITPPNSSTIETPQPPTTYAANMTIYLNPAGYFEFAIANSSTNDIFSTNPQLYQNTLPDQSILAELNISNENNQTTFSGIIFYASATELDISPIENVILNGNGQLTQSMFLNYVESNIDAFYNATTIVQSPGCSSIISLTTNSVTNTATSPISYASPLFGIIELVTNAISNSGLSSYCYIPMPASQAVSFYQDAITQSNYPYQVYWNFEGQSLGTGQSAVYAFNSEYDNTFNLNYYQTQFYSTVIPELFIFSFIIILLLAFNGVNS